MNYVYVPIWLLIVLAGMAFVGFEFAVSRIVHWLERVTRPRPVKVDKPAIVLLEDVRKAAGKSD